MLCIHVNNNDDNNNDNINNNKINTNDHLGDNEKMIFVLRGCNSSTKKKSEYCSPIRGYWGFRKLHYLFIVHPRDKTYVHDNDISYATHRSFVDEPEIVVDL